MFGNRLVIRPIWVTFLLAPWIHLSCIPTSHVSVPPSQAQPLSAKAEGKKPDKEATSIAVRLPWQENTFSPRPASSPDPRLDDVESACGQGDASLHEVADWLATHFLEHDGAASIDLANFHLRRLGSPYVMPRLWSAQMSPLDEQVVLESVDSWATQRAAVGEYRCGVAAAELADGTFAVVVIQADVLVDLQPVPTQVEPGSWLALEAHLLVSATDATVLLLPPVGLPRRLRTKVEDSTIKARFPIETEGTWLVQLMATVQGGPRPVAQLNVTAGTLPPDAPDAQTVPGEEAADPKLDNDDALFAAVNAAREDQGLPSLKRNRRLDAIARAHSEEMMRQGRISHDTGKGDPAYRVENSGLHPKATGENVALAGSAVRLHRALWGSPSHRENMLLLRWNELGVAVIKGKDDLLYATQLYIDSD